jgi:hypothetical protein
MGRLLEFRVAHGCAAGAKSEAETADGTIPMTMRYAYDYDVGCARRALYGFQEEGEYEYAAYHHGAESGGEEAHVEEAVLVQPLAPEGVVPLCEDTQRTSTPCGVNGSLFSRGWNWVKKHAEKLLAVATGFVGTVVIGGVTLVASLGCEAGSDGLDSAECFKITAFGAGFTAGAFSSTVAAWNHTP